MKNKVSISSNTLEPKSVIVTIDGKEIPHSRLMGVDIYIRPDSVISAKVELIIDELDIKEARLIYKNTKISRQR